MNKIILALCTTILLALCTTILLCSICQATIVKVYHPDLEPYASEMVAKIPEAYLEGLTKIGFYKGFRYCQHKGAIYQVIGHTTIVRICSLYEDDLVHEIAHHNSVMSHNKTFWDKYREIKARMYPIRPISINQSYIKSIAINYTKPKEHYYQEEIFWKNLQAV